MADDIRSSPNGFKWNRASPAFAEGRDGKPNSYSALQQYEQFSDWLHGRLERDEARKLARG